MISSTSTSLLKKCEHFVVLDELTVPRYRTEKPSKSPPPPPPRRSFPSSPGLTSRSGEPLIPGKSIKVKLRKCKNTVLLCMLHINNYEMETQNTLLTNENRVFLRPVTLVFVFLEDRIGRNRRSETSYQTEEGCVRKPPSCLDAPHSRL